MKTLLFFALLLCSQWSIAQKESPKWIGKAKESVFSIITYDKADKMLNTGNGFFISEDGIAISDYSLFKGADKAVVITSEGEKLNVKYILGADDMYDIVKFHVQVNKKAPYYLPVASPTPTQGATIYVLPYSTKKERNCTTGHVKETASLPGGYNYYTLDIPFSAKNVSCPVVNEAGEVFALIQHDGTKQADESYAIDAAFAASLNINALTANSSVYKPIGIRKALPPTEEQALVCLMMETSLLDKDAYLERINTFIDQYPKSSEGYIRRASHYVYNYPDQAHFSLADADLDKALSLTSKKDDVYYNKAKLIFTNANAQTPVKYKDWGYDKALEEAGKALAIQKLPLYQLLRGDIYFSMQTYAKALECYEDVNHTKMVSPESLYKAAKAKQQQKVDINEVIALMDSAINLYGKPYPQNIAPYILECAQLKEAQGRFAEAVQSYDAYSECTDGNVNDLFYYLREQANYKSKNFKRALEDIESALAITTNDVTYLAEKGAVLLRIARYDQAIECLNKALQIDPQFAACYRLIGFCQMQQGHKDKACENFNKAKALNDTAVDGLIQKNCR